MVKEAKELVETGFYIYSHSRCPNLQETEVKRISLQSTKGKTFIKATNSTIDTFASLTNGNVFCICPFFQGHIAIGLNPL